MAWRCEAIFAFLTTNNQTFYSKIGKRASRLSTSTSVTATFSDESTPYFPNKANHYILASFTEIIGVLDDIKNHKMDRLSLMFSFSSPLFERSGDKLNYVSLYFTKYTNGDAEVSELANAIARQRKGQEG